MREATEGKVKWESVDKDIFICFWQYAYTSNYDQPTVADADAIEKTTVLGNVKSPMDSKEERVKEHVEFAEPEPAELTPEPVVEVNEYYWGDFVSTNKKKCMEKPPLSKQEQLWAKLVALRRVTGDSEASHCTGDIETRAASEKMGQLLCHAKVYVFADCYDIVPLMTLSFNKLHESLVNLNFSAESLGDFVTLVQYCFETDVPDDLKEMIVLFAACEVERLRHDKKFGHLLDAHAELGKLVLWGVVDRL